MLFLRRSQHAAKFGCCSAAEADLGFRNSAAGTSAQPNQAFDIAEICPLRKTAETGFSAAVREIGSLKTALGGKAGGVD
jgi:hypothetical protein